MVIHVFFCNMLSAYKQKKVQNLTKTRRFFFDKFDASSGEWKRPKFRKRPATRMVALQGGGNGDPVVDGCCILFVFIIFIYQVLLCFCCKLKQVGVLSEFSKVFISTLIVNKYMYIIPWSKPQESNP